MASDNITSFSLPRPEIVLSTKYLEKERDSFKSEKLLIETLHLNKIIQNLKAMGHSSDEARDLGKSMMEIGERMDDFNPDPETDAFANFNDLLTECNDIANRANQICFCSNVLHITSIIVDQDKRLKQFASMLAILGGTQQKSHATTCLSYADMKQKIRKFLAESTDSVEGIIIFNSHGNENGLKFQDEPHPIDINDVCRDVYELRLSMKDPITALEIPFRVRLVFAQCWSHMAEIGECEIHGFGIVALSSPHKPQTTYTYIPITIQGEDIYKEWHHKELDAWAQKMKGTLDSYVSQPADRGRVEGATAEGTEQQGPENVVGDETENGAHSEKTAEQETPTRAK